MNRTPLFSILIPTHNRADILAFAIRSALWQTEEDFELLVAGDGCTDETSSVVASFRDDRVRWFDLPKARGFGYATRNTVLREARGRFIAYLAHDDIWFPDHLALLRSRLDASRAEFACARALAVDLDGRMMPYWCNLEIPRHRDEMYRRLSGIPMCSVVHARDCLARYGYWDESLARCGDLELWGRILGLAPSRTGFFVPEPTSLHFIASWRVTRELRGRMRILRWLVDDFLRDSVPPALRLGLSSQPPQQTAWEHLSGDPARVVGDIRRAAVQLQDAWLWGANTVPGLVGIRIGVLAGRVLDRAWKGVRFLSRDLRFTRRELILRRPRTERSVGAAEIECDPE